MPHQYVHSDSDAALELGDSAESKFDSIRFTIVASLGDRVVNFLEIQYRLEFYSNLQIFMGTVLKQVFF